MARGRKGRHVWIWIDHGERFAFGDPDKPYAVDFYRCARCGRETSVRVAGYKDPPEFGCKVD